MRNWLRKRMESTSGATRRDLFRKGSLLAAAQAIGGSFSRAVAAPLDFGATLYQSIGVRPVINSRGTFTIITGSQTLPEVKKAMDEASRHFVQMDELMDSVGKRLAEITQAPWGIVTNGCCAALTHFTAACIAGFNPERMQQLPDLTGLKSEVIIPSYSRNQYDHAIRMLGVKVVEVKDPAELESAFSERTALVYILAGPGDEGPLGTAAIAAVAKKHNVPVIVDAAAEVLTIPNVHLQRGAAAVAYSGGKCMRGPQAAGLLLGDKALLQAAWINSAPHHAFGRSLKVGKEEIMGMLAAVEAWTKRDYKAEYKTWESWLAAISAKVTKVAGVTTEVRAPNSLSNHAPTLNIRWDGAQIGITGMELEKALLDTEPRVILGSARGSRRGDMASAISIMPYMMNPQDHVIVADRVHALLAKPPKIDPAAAAAALGANIAGQWKVEMKFFAGSAQHRLFIEQNERNLVGMHSGEMLRGELAGTIDGQEVRFRSRHPYEGSSLGYEFTGTVSGNKMSGSVAMGEYGIGEWTAERYNYRAG